MLLTKLSQKQVLQTYLANSIYVLWNPAYWLQHH